MSDMMHANFINNCNKMFETLYVENKSLTAFDLENNATEVSIFMAHAIALVKQASEEYYKDD